jgi:hypothetical protein
MRGGHSPMDIAGICGVAIAARAGGLLKIRNYHPVLDSFASPQSNLRDAHTPVWEPAHRDSVQPRSGIQPGAKSVAAPFIRAHVSDIEVLTDFQPVNALCNFAVLAWWLDAWTEMGMLERDAVLVAARGIDDLSGTYGAVRVDPIALPPTVCSGRVGDFLTVAMSFRW